MSDERFDYIVECLKKGWSDHKISLAVAKRWKISRQSGLSSVQTVWKELARNSDYTQKAYHRNRISLKFEYLFSEAMAHCSIDSIIEELKANGVPKEAWGKALAKADPLKAMETARKMLESLCKLQGLNEPEKHEHTIKDQLDLKRLTNAEREARIDELLAKRQAARAMAKKHPDEPKVN